MTRAVMILADQRDIASLNFEGIQVPGFDRVIVRVADYARLKEEAATIKAEIERDNVGLVIYARNDQIFERHSIAYCIRYFQTGYSSISGIDTEEAFSQARSMIADLQGNEGIFEVPPIAAPTKKITAQPQGTFSLIFDTEQLACIKVGLPRILPLLDQYGVKATFFCTGFVQDVYPKALPTIAERGHEIGIHGPHHEWMAGLSADEQRRRLTAHVEKFRHYYPVVGANFIFRTDAHTVPVLVDLGMRYCTAFALHHYKPLAYRQVNTQPIPIITDNGGIWMVPVPTETYNWPWFGTRLAIDSALMRSKQETGQPHVSVLMHPFRDGTKNHLKQLEAMLEYLTQKRQLKPVTLEQHVTQPAPTTASKRIYMNYLRVDGSHPDGYQREFWSRAEYYWDRLSTLYLGLKAIGTDAALTVEPENIDYAVHPEAPTDGIPIPYDPMAASHDSTNSPEWERLLKLLREAEAAGGTHVFAPPSAEEQQAFIRKLKRPRNLRDVTGLPPEAGMRVVFKLRKGRPTF
ncbi:MAG: polysaccharide deacetylase family protein [Chloroflexi bacterium]|nr:polysaccharide deacetylase family protein [Chloroflexota bacterium]